MKKYLRMSGHFVGNVSINTDGQICDDKYFRGSTDIAEDYYAQICNAINSHDELVAMNKELLAALEKVVSDITALSENSYGVHGLHRNGDLAPWNSLFSGGFFEGWLLSIDEAGDVIAKAKAAS